MNISYKVLPTFAAVHKDTNPFIFVMGPVGSGKSSGCIWHAFLNAMRQVPDRNNVRHSRHLVIRATYPALRSTTIKTWLEWFKDKITIVYSTPIVARLIYPLSDGTSINMEIFFMSVDDESSVEKLRSLEVTSCHINEASEISESAFQMLKTRMGRFPAKVAQNPFIILDYNAVSTDHWIYRLTEEDKPKLHSFYRQPPAMLRLLNGKYVVNPEAENLENLPKDYYETICAGNHDEFINVNVLNNYGESRAGRPVYKDFSDIEHTTSNEIRPLKGIPVVIGLDQGITPAAVFTQLLPTGKLIVFDEIVAEDCSLREFSEDYLWPTIKAKYPWIAQNFTVVCDPATRNRSQNDARSGMDILKETGLPVKSAKTNVFMERKEAVVHFLRRKGMFELDIKKCPIVRKGFIAEYKYEPSKTINGILYKEKPLKNKYSHPHDALQYAALEFISDTKRSKMFKQISNSKNKPRYSAASRIGGY